MFKNSKMISLSIIVSSILIIKIEARTEWIDPFSMEDDAKPEWGGSKICENTNSELLTAMHFKRYLNLFINSLAYDRVSQLYTGVSYLTTEEYDFIKEFTQIIESKTGEANLWNKLDRILSKVYTKSSWEDYSNMVIGWKQLFMLYILSFEFLLGLCSVFMIYITVHLMRKGVTLYGCFKGLFIIGVITDFAFTWIRLMKEKEVDKMMKTIKFKGTVPRECDPSNMSWFEYLWAATTNNNRDRCKEFYESQYIDILWSVGIGEIVGTQIGTFIKTPAEAIGKSFGLFYKGIVGTFSWWMLPTIPFALIFVLFLICIILSFLTKTSIEFNLLHLVKFSFGKEDRVKFTDSISGPSLHKLIDVLNNTTIRNPESKKKIECKKEDVDSRAGGDYIQDISPSKLKELSPIKTVKNQDFQEISQLKLQDLSLTKIESSETAIIDELVEKCTDLSKNGGKERSEEVVENISVMEEINE